MARTYTIPGRGSVTEDQYRAYWTQTLNSDPAMQSLIQQKQRATPFSAEWKNTAAQIEQRAQQLGYAPTDHDEGLRFKDGQLTPDRGNYLDRNKEWIGPLIAGAAIGGPFAAAALGSGATAAATAPAASSAAPTIASTGLPALGLPGSTAISTGVGAGGTWASALKSLIPLGLQVGGNLITNRQQSGAIDKAQEAQQKATADAQARIDAAQGTAGQVYNQQRADYQNLANVPMQALGNALGIPIADVGPVSVTGGAGGATLGEMAQTPTTPLARTRPVEVPAIGKAQPRTLGELASPREMPTTSPQQVAQQQGQSGYVRLRSPDGAEVEDVPVKEAPLWLQRGAMRVS